MNFLKKLFNKNKKSGEEIIEMMDDIGMEVEISSGSEAGTRDIDYKHNHCFVFFGLNQEGFEVIEKEVQNFDGPDHLSLLRSQAGVFMTDICLQSAASEKVKDCHRADEVDVKNPEFKAYEQFNEDMRKLKDYVETRFDLYQQQIKEELITDDNKEIGTDFLDLLKKERNYIIENMTYGMKQWAESDYFEKEDFIGAMIVFVKSSKEFDEEDSISENQEGMNLVVTTRNGFIRDCIFALEDTINVKWEDNVTEDQDRGIVYAEETECFQNREEDDINRYAPCTSSSTIFGAFTENVPVGITYFDQKGRLWNIKEVSKAVTLVHEALDEYERTVSH